MPKLYRVGNNFAIICQQQVYLAALSLTFPLSPAIPLRGGWDSRRGHDFNHVSPYKQLMVFKGFPTPWCSMAVMMQSVYQAHSVVQGGSLAASSAASVYAEICVVTFYPSEGAHGFCSYLKVDEKKIQYAFICWLSPGSEGCSTYLNISSLLWEFLPVLPHSLKVPPSAASCAPTHATDYNESCAIRRAAQQYSHEDLLGIADFSNISKLKEKLKINSRFFF